MIKTIRKHFSQFSIIFLSILVISALWMYWRQTKIFVDQGIVDDVKTLQHIFNRIDKSCGIIDFEYQKNHIDFLNVATFVGSEIGPMNVRYPKKWQGPYLQDNPTMQEKYYQVVRTDKGYFVVPGDGVRLKSGSVIGKDIVFGPDTDIQALIDNGTLLFDDKQMAAKITVSG